MQQITDGRRKAQGDEQELNSGFANNESTARGNASFLFPLMQYGHILGTWGYY